MTRRIMLAAVAAVFAAGAAANEQAAMSFSQLDRNNDGSLSRAEWQSVNAPRDVRQDQRQQSSSRGSAAVVLMPLADTQAASFNSGCWARLYDSDGFSGDALTVTGPAAMPNLRTGSGSDWGGSFDSLQVGPRATLTVYDNENYGQRTATYEANQRIADLDESRGMLDDIRSLKMACRTASKTAQAGNAGNGASTGE